MRSRFLVTAAAAFALTACGSTVQLQGQAAQGGESLSTSPQAGTADTPETGEATTRTVTAEAQATGSAARVPIVTSPPAVTRSVARKAPVEVGVVLFPDVGTFAKSLGGSAEVGDQRAMAETAIRWVNAHGGLAGHKVVPVYFEVELTSTQPYSVTYEQICTSFTQDHHVVAALVIANGEPAMPRCLAKTKTLYLVQGHYLFDAPDYRSLWNMVAPEDAGADRIARALVDEIGRRDLVKRGDKLGLLVFDYAAPQRARDRIIVPAMKARGVEVVSYTVPWPQSTPDIANSASVVQSAQLAMAAQGVRTVTFVCPGCVAFFMQYAESQAYYPRYVISSLDNLQNNYKGKGHGRSLAGSVALGWDPIADVGVYTNPGLLKGNATYALCRSIEKDHYSDDATLFAALAFCGAVQSLYKAALANPVSPVTGTSLLAGFNALGTSYDGAANFTTRVAPDQHDGVTSYRTMHYESGCDCMAYDSGLRPLR